LHPNFILSCHSSSHISSHNYFRILDSDSSLKRFRQSIQQDRDDAGRHNRRLVDDGIVFPYSDDPQELDGLYGVCDGCRRIGPNMLRCIACQGASWFQVPRMRDLQDSRPVHARVDTLFYALHMGRISNADIRGTRGYTPPEPTSLLMQSRMLGTMRPWEENTRLLVTYTTPYYHSRLFAVSYPSWTHERRLVMESLLGYHMEDLFQGEAYTPIFQTMIDEWRQATFAVHEYAQDLLEFHLTIGRQVPRPVSGTARGRQDDNEQHRQQQRHRGEDE
jgi:hypothetical protein